MSHVKDKSKHEDWVGSIITISGAQVDLILPRADQFDIDDIAHALGNVCRFGGHVPHFYSVAEHSVRVMRHVSHLPYHVQLAGLLHDAAEAYIGDMVRPLKRSQPLGDAYMHVEDEINKTMIPHLTQRADLYSSKDQFGDIIHEADMATYQWEVGNIRTGFQPGWSPEFARREFLNEYYRLMPF